MSSSDSVGGRHGHLHHADADWVGWLFIFTLFGVFLLFVCVYGGYAYGYSKRVHTTVEVRDANNKVERRLIIDQEAAAVSGDAYPPYHHHHRYHSAAAAAAAPTSLGQLQLRY